jgi:cation diffusion facilitator CzcD-associated flavoprotein CzcO
MRIACVGAGASGLCFAYKLQRSFQNFSLTVYEKGPDVGGVWLQNRYPGYVNNCNHSTSFQNMLWRATAADHSYQVRMRLRGAQLYLFLGTKV